MWPEEETIREAIRGEFRGPFGDRRQELVIIGRDLDRQAIRERLDACLLDDTEMRIGPVGWHHLPDPFPAWEAETDDETDIAVITQPREIPRA
jgi:hypothetical protein